MSIFFFWQGAGLWYFSVLDLCFCMGRVEVWAIGWLGLLLLFISSTWIGLRVLTEGLLWG